MGLTLWFSGADSFVKHTLVKVIQLTWINSYQSQPITISILEFHTSHICMCIRSRCQDNVKVKCSSVRIDASAGLCMWPEMVRLLEELQKQQPQQYQCMSIKSSSDRASWKEVSCWNSVMVWSKTWGQHRFPFMAKSKPQGLTKWRRSLVHRADWTELGSETLGQDQ